MFNQTKITSLVMTVIVLFFSAGCGISKPTAVSIASRPPDQPVEVTPGNAGEGEVLPQTALNLSGDAGLSSAAAPALTTPEEMISDGNIIPAVENKVSPEKIIEPEGNRASKPIPMIENQGNWPDQSPEHLRQQQSVVSTQENEIGVQLIDVSNPTTLSHWEQKWLVPK